MKKLFEYFGLFSLICFSFFLTEKTATVIKEVDDLMIQIKEHQKEVEEEGMDATIKGDTIIPGLAKKTVEVEKSYEKMKSLGVYDENYLVFKYQLPSISIVNHKEKYIIQGNPKKRSVSLLFLLRGNQISSLFSKLGNRKAALLLTGEEITTNFSLLEPQFSTKQIVFQPSSQEDFLELYQKLVSYEQQDTFCYNPKKDSKFLDLCQKYQLFSLSPNILISSHPLQQTKEVLSAGTILVYEVNAQLLKELPNILAYIDSKGYTIESLSTHLKEDS